MADDFSFKIEKYLGKFGEGKGGWGLELNLVSWGNRPAKYDIRSWDSEHKQMGKGVTLTIDDLKNLKNLLNSIELSE